MNINYILLQVFGGISQTADKFDNITKHVMSLLSNC